MIREFFNQANQGFYVHHVRPALICLFVYVVTGILKLIFKRVSGNKE
jgi:hypothetical protein